VSDSVEGWCAAGNLGASRVSIRMDDWMDGQRDDRTDGRRDGFRGSFISSRRPQPLSVRLQGKLHSSFTSLNHVLRGVEQSVKNFF
jgi:hypothetical protein